jgi:hypothetical protein
MQPGQKHDIYTSDTPVGKSLELLSPADVTAKEFAEL